MGVATSTTETTLENASEVLFCGWTNKKGAQRALGKWGSGKVGKWESGQRGSGQWEVGSGQWAVGSGQWEVGSGKEGRGQPTVPGYANQLPY